MKTFNQFITEGRDAPLYHSLRFSERVSTILTNRQLIPTTEQNLKSVGLKRKGDPNFGQPESEGRVTGMPLLMQQLMHLSRSRARLLLLTSI